MDRIFEISDINTLREYLSGMPDTEGVRQRLHAEFIKHSQYCCAAEWNAAVRICEALAIVGWGAHEPLEAIRGVYFNGNPNTYFINKYGKPRFLDAVWSKRKDGVAIDPDLSFIHGNGNGARPLDESLRAHLGAATPQNIPLCSQRNWIPKNPVRIIRGLANCYSGSKPLIDSIESLLIPNLNRNMRPELYGSALNMLTITLSFSFYDNYHCKTNYIIADESLKLKQKDFYPKLLEMYTEQEIDDNGYYLRNRFSHGPFRTDTGCASVKIVFEREFSQMPLPEQKRTLCAYLMQAVDTTARRLRGKITYDFPLMLSDLNSILNSWLELK